MKRGLATGEFGAGTPVERLIQAHTPLREYRHDEFVTLEYGPPDEYGGTTVVAYCGEIVSAVDGWCSAAHVFFDTMPDPVRPAYDRSLTAEVDRRFAARMAAFQSVAGAAWVEFDVRSRPAKSDP